MIERERTFLDRIGRLVRQRKACSPADLKRLHEGYLRWQDLEKQAAEYVESPICMRSPTFTGEQPYVGWQGLGLALRLDYDMLYAATGFQVIPPNQTYPCGVQIESRGKHTWAIVDMGVVLNRNGEWEDEPHPSDRNEAFIARTRFQLDEAWELAQTLRSDLDEWTKGKAPPDGAKDGGA